MKPINAEETVRVFNGWLEEADSLAEREAIECCIDHIREEAYNTGYSEAEAQRASNPAPGCRGSARSRLRGAGRFSALSRKPTSP